MENPQDVHDRLLAIQNQLARRKVLTEEIDELLHEIELMLEIPHDHTESQNARGQRPHPAKS